MSLSQKLGEDSSLRRLVNKDDLVFVRCVLGGVCRRASVAVDKLSLLTKAVFLKHLNQSKRFAKWAGFYFY